MYLASKQLNTVDQSRLTVFQRQTGLTLPPTYCHFLETCGEGTYCGNLDIGFPDEVVLQTFASYDFWNHDNAPITKTQIGECISLGCSVDGDYLAIHADVDGLIMLPRGSDEISLFKFDKSDFCSTLDAVFTCLYGEDPGDTYFEPSNPDEKFVRLRSFGDLHSLARSFKSAFAYDFLIEDEKYTCQVFILDLGGSVRFNLAGGLEVVIRYSNSGWETYSKVRDFFNRNSCVEW